MRRTINIVSFLRSPGFKKIQGMFFMCYQYKEGLLKSYRIIIIKTSRGQIRWHTEKIKFSPISSPWFSHEGLSILYVQYPQDLDQCLPQSRALILFGKGVNELWFWCIFFHLFLPWTFFMDMFMMPMLAFVPFFFFSFHLPLYKTCSFGSQNFLNHCL